MRCPAYTLTLLLIQFLLAGCSSNFVSGDREPLIQLSHISSEDSPVVTTVKIYERRIEVASLRGFSKSKRIESERSLVLLRALLALPGWAEIATEEGLGSHHSEELWLESGDWVVGFRRDDPPDELRPILDEIDRLVFKYFRKPFDKFH